jgi:hypothetical protein
MLGLEKLTREDGDAPQGKIEAAPPQSGGCLFSSSLGLGSLFTVAALALYALAVFWTPEQTIESVIEDVNVQLDTYEFDELLSFWDQVDQSGLGEAIPPPFFIHARIARRLRIGAIICGSIAALGFLMSTVLFIRDFKVVRE